MNTALWIGILVLAVLLLAMAWWVLDIHTTLDRQEKNYKKQIANLIEYDALQEERITRLEQDNIAILAKSAEFNETEMKMIEDMQTEIFRWKEMYTGFMDAYQREYLEKH